MLTIMWLYLIAPRMQLICKALSENITGEGFHVSHPALSVAAFEQHDRFLQEGAEARTFPGTEELPGKKMLRL